MKVLGGSELAMFVKNRQAKQVRALRQAHHTIPKLCIVMSKNSDEVIRTYVRMKQRYAEDILIEVEVLECEQADMLAAIEGANANPSIDGIIVQLPIDDVSKTDEIVNTIASKKDVDGLGEHAAFVSATAEAVDWLLAGNGVELEGKKIAIVGKGKLVGGPLEKMWHARGFNISMIDTKTPDADEVIRSSKLVVSGTGVPGRLHNKNISPGTIVVDAGTASEEGAIVGDMADELYDRTDLRVTPKKGGVGPLTVVVMFDHVIRAALATIDK